MEGEVLLLGERHRPDFGTWNVPEASHLWNFNLHYFEYCIPLAARWRDDRDGKCLSKLKGFINGWMGACSYPQGDAWHPYTISLRLVNWLVCRDLISDALVADPEFDEAMRLSMYVQYRHLLVNQETHLLANHYLENLKTLVIFSKLFGEDDVFRKVWRDFEGQLEEQILPDGVHFERSLMYHKLVFEGLLRVCKVMEGLGDPVPGILVEKTQAMLDAMASLEKGMGKTPFFNDSADGVAKECDQLIAACGAVLGLRSDGSRKDFLDAGYYKLYSEDGRIAIMMDAGMPGPPYMLGHAHCDCLSYELSIDGRPVIANCGTYAYQSDLRTYFRSTAAHNTMVVNGNEQLECWGEHRVARGYKDVKLCERESNRLVARLELSNGFVIRRVLSLSRRSLTIEDSVEEGEGMPLSSWVHLRNGKGVRIECESGVPEFNRVSFSPRFGVIKEIDAWMVSGCGSVSYRLLFEEME